VGFAYHAYPLPLKGFEKLLKHMAFGMTYELAIVIFIVLFGLLFIVGGYDELKAPAIQIVEALGLFLIIIGFARRDYDTLFSGVLLVVVGIAMSLSLGTEEKGILSGTSMLAPYAQVFAASLENPVLVVLALLIIAYIISRT